MTMIRPSRIQPQGIGCLGLEVVTFLSALAATGLAGFSGLAFSGVGA